MRTIAETRQRLPVLRVTAMGKSTLGRNPTPCGMTAFPAIAMLGASSTPAGRLLSPCPGAGRKTRDSREGRSQGNCGLRLRQRFSFFRRWYEKQAETLAPILPVASTGAALPSGYVRVPLFLLAF